MISTSMEMGIGAGSCPSPTIVSAITRSRAEVWCSSGNTCRDSLSRFVTLGQDTSRAVVSQSALSGQLVRVSADGEAGYYMLMATATGVSLYDVNANRIVHFVGWES